MNVVRVEGLTAVFVNKETHSHMHVLQPMNKLEKRELDYLIVNHVPFERKDFECKNGRFNRSKACRLLIWAYEIEFLTRFANSTL